MSERLVNWIAAFGSVCGVNVLELNSVHLVIWIAAFGIVFVLFHFNSFA